MQEYWRSLGRSEFCLSRVLALNKGTIHPAWPYLGLVLDDILPPISPDECRYIWPRKCRTVPDRRWVMWSEFGVLWNRREPRRIWRRREIGLLFPLFVGGLAFESEDGSREDFNGAGIRWVCNEWPNDEDDEKDAGCRSNCRAAEKKVSPLAGTLTIPPSWESLATGDGAPLP